MGKRIRRLFFRWALKGCKVDHPDALAYVKNITGSWSIENEIAIERALELQYWAKWIGGTTGGHNAD